MDTAARTGDGPADAYTHAALLYDSLDELVTAAAPFVRAGLAAGEPVVLATGTRTADALLEAVDAAPGVHLVPRADTYDRRTATAITAFRRLADRFVAEGAARIRVVGEIDFGRTERDRLEWQRYEAVLNEALSPWPISGTCVFDTQQLPDPVLAAALATHPVLATATGYAPNPDFVEPARYLRELPVLPEPLEETPPRLDVRDVADFIALRHAVAAELATVRGHRDLVDDFLLATDEMLSNAARHGGPPVDLSLWASEGTVVCRIRDRGPGFDDPFAGYGPAHGEDLSRGGMGLWLARQLCDHVDITQDACGVTVRLATHLR
ncbi:anti-sigma factor RsbA family regulatory protein [Geodermatophilus sp. CPCC 205506]|uniref:anti-sigma factor RsbA family regulatory protein n=1 Tax=Geodermatophilus sp. CPCC 205506 TaxID=2936596 RepID=UPI003EE8927D